MMKGKTPSETATRGLRVSNTLLRGHLNTHGTLYGGHLMELMDEIGAVVAMQHAETLCVTKFVDSMEFVAPVQASDDLMFWASVNRVWNTSLEVGIRACAVSPNSAVKRHVVSAYFTFVALDPKTGFPISVLPLLPSSNLERRRFAQADVRRAWRLEQRNAKEQKS